jgi:Carboxypeptidase regulatory-like domain
MKRLIASFAIGLILPSFVSLAAAQSLTTGAISGTVADQSGALMGSVVVTAKNVDTGATRETQTSGNGNFLLAQLDPGRYEVTAESTGFEKTKIGPITVAVSRVVSLEFKLKIGSETATVEVKQEAPLIEPANPNTTTTLNSTQLAEIPNPGNDLSYVANLAPGAVMNTVSPLIGGAGNTEFNGLPAVANNFSIDGLDANNPYQNKNATGASGLQLGLNAIEEVSINTASYSVDQGRQEAAQVNYITKSGTNSFHGNAYEVWNGSAMNARTFFNNLKGIRKKPRSNVNEFGASGSASVPEHVQTHRNAKWGHPTCCIGVPI